MSRLPKELSRFSWDVRDYLFGGKLAWIESHVDIGEHPKVYHLCQYLMVEKPEAVGLLHLIWHLAMKYAWRDGDLRRFTATAIASAVGWKKDPDTLIRALHECGWLERDSLVIHDWLQYAGKLVTDRLYQEKRRLTAIKFDEFRKTPATVPNRTIPTTTTSPAGEMFASFWKAYPKKIGKGAAEKAWKKIPDVKAVFEQILGAVVAQCRSSQWLKEGGQFIPHPATWLNQKRWEDEVSREVVVG